MRARTARLIVVSALAAAFVAAEAASFAPRADAAHHLIRIRQVFDGGGVSQEFAVLQLTSPNENFLVGATVTFYSDGAMSNAQQFNTMPANGESQRTVLAAGENAQTAFGVTSDLDMSNADVLVPEGGAVCLSSGTFPDVDCVEWGTGTPDTLPSNPGPPEPAIPMNNMIQRSIANGCPTLHELGDDTNNSDADFFPVPIDLMTFDPRNNAAPIMETGCAPPSLTTPTFPSAGTPGKKTRARICKKKPSKNAAVTKKKCKRKKK
jgi:hypothetical protein